MLGARGGGGPARPGVTRSSAQIIDPFVEVEVIGLPVDCSKEQTRVVDDNGEGMWAPVPGARPQHSCHAGKARLTGNGRARATSCHPSNHPAGPPGPPPQCCSPQQAAQSRRKVWAQVASGWSWGQGDTSSWWPPGFNPMWEETLVFVVHMPDIALVRFLVWDHDPIGRDFIGQRTLAFSSMMPGGQGCQQGGEGRPRPRSPRRPASSTETSFLAAAEGLGGGFPRSPSPGPGWGL